MAHGLTGQPPLAGPFQDRPPAEATPRVRAAMGRPEEVRMDREKHWHVELSLDEHENRTHAEARLDTGTTRLVGTGTARLSPDDTNVPEIGDELAASRALSALAHQLLDTAASDIEGITHRPVHLSR